MLISFFLTFVYSDSVAIVFFPFLPFFIYLKELLETEKIYILMVHFNWSPGKWLVCQPTLKLKGYLMR